MQQNLHTRTVNTTLEHVDLSYCIIGPVGVQHMTQYIRTPDGGEPCALTKVFCLFHTFFLPFSGKACCMHVHAHARLVCMHYTSNTACKVPKFRTHVT